MSGSRPATAKDDFLRAFDLDLQAQVLNFAAELDEIKADVMLFTARMAACMFDAMCEVGLVRTRAMASSDRVLDMDLGWVQGKSVAVVDDVLITGSTLYRIRKVLLDAGAREVTTHVLAVDRDNWVEDLVSPTNSQIQLSATRALTLCTQIVNALSLVPRPYNLDWPLLQGVTIPDHDAIVLGGLAGWRTTDVTSSLQQQHGVFSLTLDATRVTRSRLAAIVGPGVMPASLMKVRVYGRRASYARAQLELRALPIVAFDSLDLDTVDRMFDSVAGPAGVAEFTDHFTTPTSKARLIQFALSRALGDLWLDDLTAATRVRRPGSLEKEQVLFAFPPQVAAALMTPHAPPYVAAWESPDLQREDSPAAKLKSMNEVLDALTAPFVDLYLNKEIRAREILKDRGRAAFEDQEHSQLLDRLSTGHSPHELRAIAREYSDADGIADEIVSAFLDIAIDHGVIVPIAESRGQMVRRAYRHGEDVLFTEVDHALFAIMLDAASNGVGVPNLDRITIEKLCVIFLRIAVQKVQLNRWTGRLGAPGTIGVRWYLHGARVQADTENIYGAANGTGLVENLIKRGALEKEKNSGRLRVAHTLEHSSAPLSENAVNLARQVGLIFGARLADKSDQQLTINDLILLASCSNQGAVAGAGP